MAGYANIVQRMDYVSIDYIVHLVTPITLKKRMKSTLIWTKTKNFNLEEFSMFIREWVKKAKVVQEENMFIPDINAKCKEKRTRRSDYQNLNREHDLHFTCTNSFGKGVVSTLALQQRGKTRNARARKSIFIHGLARMQSRRWQAYHALLPDNREGYTW